MKYYVFADCVLFEESWGLDVRDGNAEKLQEVSYAVQKLSGGFYSPNSTEETILSFFSAESLDDAFVYSKDVAVSGYALSKKNGVLPAFISEDEYTSLPDSFQRKYTPQMKPEVEVLTPITESSRYEIGFTSDETASEYFGVGSRLTGSYISTRYNNAERFFFVDNMAKAIKTEVQNLHSPRIMTPESGFSSSYVRFEYLENDYDGATKKVYDRFKNGRLKSTYRVIKDYKPFDSIGFDSGFGRKRLEHKDFDVLTTAVRKIAEKLAFTQGEKGL